MLHFVEPEHRLTRHWPLLLGAALKRAGQHQDFWLTLPWQDISASSLLRYQQLFNFAAEHRPLTSYFLPIQRAQLYCMLKKSFGFSPIGLIHTQNTMRWLQPAPTSSAPLQLSTAVQLLPSEPEQPLICQFSSYLHPKLAQFPADPSELPSVFLSCQSHYLLKRGRSTGQSSNYQAPDPASAVANWQVAANAGRQYAKLSGDFNPIHLTDITARLLGMRQAIIHGMHTVATVEAHLRRSEPQISMLDAQFKRALPLGKNAMLFQQHAGKGSVWQQDNLVLQFEYC